MVELKHNINYVIVGIQSSLATLHVMSIAKLETDYQGRTVTQLRTCDTTEEDQTRLQFGPAIGIHLGS